MSRTGWWAMTTCKKCAASIWFDEDGRWITEDGLYYCQTPFTAGRIPQNPWHEPTSIKEVPVERR